MIDAKAFLGALLQIGYDGPIRAEPFNQRLDEMGDDDASRATVAAMRKAFALGRLEVLETRTGSNPQRGCPPGIASDSPKE